MRKYAKYYQMDETTGEYRYVGPHYRFSQSGDALRKRKRLFLAYALAALAAFLGAGLTDAGETRAFYIALPYALSFLPAAFGVSAALGTLRLGARMTLPQYRRGPARLIACARGACVLGLILVLGSILHAVLVGGGTAAFPAFGALMCASGALSWRMYAADPPRAESPDAEVAKTNQIPNGY
jgi:hypothetical protein